MNSTRWAIFGDIHSNLEALQAVLEDIRHQGIDQLLCLGDVVGYNANPVECVETLRALGCPVLRGNHDEVVARDDDACLEEFNPVAVLGLLYSRERVSAAQKQWLGALPMVHREAAFGAVHASLCELGMFPYIIESYDARAHFRLQDRPLYFYGHTHYPMVYTQNEATGECMMLRPRPELITLQPGLRFLVNVGAVGQPRDRDARACYGVLDVAQNTLAYRRVAYDVRLTQEKIRAAGLPEALAERLALGK